MKLSILSFLILTILGGILVMAKDWDHDLGNPSFCPKYICHEGWAARVPDAHCIQLSDHGTLQTVGSLLHPCETPCDWKKNQPVSELPSCLGNLQTMCSCR